jgi:predicted AAA+ superfamily ATPase
MKIQRYLNIEQELSPGKTLIIFGPRRVGKTTLLTDYISQCNAKVAFYRGDELSTQHAFGVAESSLIRPFLGPASVLAIDEAQFIPNIGQTLKLINDTLPNLSLVVTESSSFDLAGQIGEPLTGRKITKYLYPIALSELLANEMIPYKAFQDYLPNLLIYGMYPDSITAIDNQERSEYLRELIDSYLLQDILAFQEVKGSHMLLQLLVLLAYQVGNEVSHTELGSSLGIDKNTVARYLNLLEKSFVIFRLGGFSRNLRSEVTKKAKYYFYDTGIRNAVINNFNRLEIRNDVGQLWENFVIVERLKLRAYANLYANQYFWRTWNQQEIDLIEEREGKLFAFEIKWNSQSVAPPSNWLEAYPTDTEWQVINPTNALGFLGIEI